MVELHSQSVFSYLWVIRKIHGLAESLVMKQLHEQTYPFYHWDSNDKNQSLLFEGRDHFHHKSFAGHICLGCELRSLPRNVTHYFENRRERL